MPGFFDDQFPDPPISYYRIQKKLPSSLQRIDPATLDKVIATDFLKTPKTGAMIATYIKEQYDVATTSGKVTALLTRHPRNGQVKLVARPEGETAAGNWYQLI